MTLRFLERAAKAAILAGARPALLGRARGARDAPLHGPIRIAAIRQDDRLGNLVLVTPFLQRLRESFPEAAIDAVVSDRYHRILDGFPGVDRVLLVRKEQAKRFPWSYAAFLRSLGRSRYDLAFDLSDANAFSLSSALMTLATRAPVRVGFTNSRSSSYLTLAVPPPKAPMHASDLPILLLRAVAGAVPPAPLTLALPGESPAVASFLAAARPNGERLAGVNLGGRGRKRWPARSYRRLLEALLDGGRVRPVLVWGPAESDLVAEFADLTARGVVAAPLLSEDDLGRLLRGLDLFITPDTGAMHVAAAVGTPVVALFLHSEREKYAPRGPQHRALGGYGEEIEVDQVLRAAEDLIGRGASARRAGERP